MNTTENIFIDTLIFNPPLPMNYEDVIEMFSSKHQQDCCEYHYLDFEWKKEEFETVKSILSKVDKIDIKWTPWMGITLRMYDWEKDFWFFIPWRSDNNWYYSENLQLIVTLPNWFIKKYDIEEYQEPTSIF